MADGVGIMVLRTDGTPVPLGLSNASSAPGEPAQIKIMDIDPGGAAGVSVKFLAAYVRTKQDMAVGSVRATATITFSYQ